MREPPTPDFLEYMLKLEKEGGDGKATSNTVEWAMAELMRKPRLLAKVREELDAVVGRDAIVEEAHLPQLPYLHAVLKETLRLHPALLLMVPHCPDADATVAGYRVPAGSRVLMVIFFLLF